MVLIIPEDIKKETMVNYIMKFIAKFITLIIELISLASIWSQLNSYNNSIEERVFGLDDIDC
jgi:hypothetical protein